MQINKLKQRIPLIISTKNVCKFFFLENFIIINLYLKQPLAIISRDSEKSKKGIDFIIMYFFILAVNLLNLFAALKEWSI